jgi:hypothetical protein
MNTVSVSRDLVARPWARAIWCSLAFVAFIGVFTSELRPLLWATSFAGSGLLCLANVVLSGRFHCMYTGPIFLAGAGVTVLRASGIVSLSWAWIGGAVFVGVVGALAWERARRTPGSQGCC